MRRLRSLVGLIALSLLGLGAIPTLPSAFATEAKVQNTQSQKTMPLIGVIHFKGGRLVQSTEQLGRWYEKRNNGKINYEFFETASTETSLELTGPHGEVKLFVDFEGKIIKGQWPGQVLKPIYTITGIEKLNAFVDPCLPPAKPLPQCPTVSVPPTVPTPPVTPPAHPDPTASIPPQDIQGIVYQGGQFVRISQTVWQNELNSGEIHPFEQIGYDQSQVYLYNTDYKIFIVLDAENRTSQIARDGGLLESFHPLLEIVGRPMVPTPPIVGGLSEAEKQACLAEGGFVERAGLLGAERCTKPFGDVGFVCSDSSQCQGQCRADVSTPIGEATTGLCQANDNPFGCYAEVVAGVAGAGLCVD